MSDLKLVSPGKPTPLEQRLLDAVANESLSADQRARVRLALGLAAVAPTPMLVAGSGRRALLLKAAGGLVVVSAGMLALFLAMGHEPRAGNAIAPQQISPAPPAAAAAVAATPSVAPPASSASDDGSDDAPAATPLASAPVPAVQSHDDERVPSKRSSKVTAADSAADLSEQLRLIDAARSAVAAHNATAASAALSSYRTRFPRGPFGQEAAVLQIETLDLQGNHALAASQARSFLARYPSSPHASVVRRIAER
jgi:hypothetical protein